MGSRLMAFATLLLYVGIHPIASGQNQKQFRDLLSDIQSLPTTPAVATAPAPKPTKVADSNDDDWGKSLSVTAQIAAGQFKSKTTVVEPPVEKTSGSVGKFRNLLEDIQGLPAPVSKPQSPPAAESPSEMVCSQNGQNQCENVHYKLGKVRIRSTQEWIAYLAPIAQYMQAKTGYPASVMIAQAIQESSGTSSLFVNHNAAFGQTCGPYGSSSSINFPKENPQFSSKGKCTVRGFDPATLKWYTYTHFNTPEDSVMGYYHNILYDDGTRGSYGRIRAIVQAARAKNPNGVASWQAVVNNMDRYAEDKTYQYKLRQTIQNYRLDQYDKNTCQSCIEAREKEQRANNEKATS